MAGSAAGAKLAPMGIILRMAGNTVGGGSLEYFVRMATGTRQADMLAGQFKAR